MADRHWLAQQLQHPPVDGSTEAELDAAWGDEVSRRLDEIDSGKVELVPGELVVERMFAKIAAHRNQR